MGGGVVKHRAVIIGAGRIGAGWNWHDDSHTHAGAYLALKDRVELVGFVEPWMDRADAATKKWGVPQVFMNQLGELNVNIVSVCVHPEQRAEVLKSLQWREDLDGSVAGIWCEKPWVWDGKFRGRVQVNYQRRADQLHQSLAIANVLNRRLVVYGKDDETTRCHFRDLARWWKVPLEYRPFQGPCAYILETDGAPFWFDAGGVDSGKCFKAMLGNLLDAVEGKADLWSPPYVESK